MCATAIEETHTQTKLFAGNEPSAVYIQWASMDSVDVINGTYLNLHRGCSEEQLITEGNAGAHYQVILEKPDTVVVA